MRILKFFVLFIPVSFAAEIFHLPPVLQFLFAALAIVPLAGYMGQATEEISFHVGPKVGGFLNATFGNATELIISIFALRAGLFDVVKASIAGSVIGNILMVLGAAMMFGGFKYKSQHFNQRVVGSQFQYAIVRSNRPLCPGDFYAHGQLRAADNEV